LALVAFLAQSFITQTHIHLTGSDGHGVLEATAGVSPISGTQKAGHGPSRDDPDHCPLCQAIAYAGHFVTPAPALLSLPALAACAAYLFQIRRIATAHAAHIWQQRAPPV